MQVFKPSYFDEFHCLAAQCPDSCCKEWDVDIDPETAARYRTLSGSLGDRLRSVLRENGDSSVFMSIEDGRCPMWRQDGLCRIQAELGHDALCVTCREFPRLRHDYGDFIELGLELSCPEAARMLLSGPQWVTEQAEKPGGEPGEYDADDMSILRATRESALALLSDTARPVNEALALLLMYGYHAQGILDGGEALPFRPDAALETARNFAKASDIQSLPRFFLELEILTEEWRGRLMQSSAPSAWSDVFRRLARYLVERYWLQAVSDYDLVGRVKLTVILCLLIRTLGGDPIRTAQLCSKEIENNTENVEAILDGAYAAEAFTDDRLLGHLLT